MTSISAFDGLFMFGASMSLQLMIPRPPPISCRTVLRHGYRLLCLSLVRLGAQ